MCELVSFLWLSPGRAREICDAFLDGGPWNSVGGGRRCDVTVRLVVPFVPSLGLVVWDGDGVRGADSSSWGTGRDEVAMIGIGLSSKAESEALAREWT